MTTITLVQKILSHGRPCYRSTKALARLREAGQLRLIDRIADADVRDPQSPGWRLAAHHGMERAPFFIVEEASGRTRVYGALLRFQREVLDSDWGARATPERLLASYPELDYV